jgi:riboflavin kinase/FMN adenylyltransferase
VRHYRTLEALAAEWERPFLAIGTFDGLHRGHQAVLAALLAAARRERAPAAVLTFVPHPLAVLRREGAPPALTTPEQRARLLAAMGLDALVELPFDPELARVGAAEFVQEYLCRRARARRAFVGAEFTFGAGGRGTPETLAVLGRQACGLETTTVPLVRYRGEPISSTRIRHALQAGRAGLAARLLGRPFALEGEVVPGERRGRSLGFPTANVELPTGVAVPARGVYAVRARLLDADGAPAEPGWAGVANLGLRPTFAGDAVRLEVHLFDFHGEELYGRRLEVAFLRRLRGERRFPNAEALRQQIARDVARARALVAGDGGAAPPAETPT